nr:hypothetical protein [Angustibacter aerolatus]
MLEPARVGTALAVVAEGPEEGRRRGDRLSTTAPHARDRQRLRVLAVPGEHPYVEHVLEPVDGDPVVDRVPDPGSLGSGRPAALSPAWVEQHAHEVDLVHLHFGFDALTPAEPDRLDRCAAPAPAAARADGARPAQPAPPRARAARAAGSTCWCRPPTRCSP